MAVVGARDSALLHHLVDEGLLSRHERFAVSQLAQQTGGNLNIALQRLGTVEPCALAAAYKRAREYPFVDLDAFRFESSEHTLLAMDCLQELRVYPVEIDPIERHIKIASTAPSRLDHRDAVQAFLSDYTLSWLQCDEAALQRAYARLAPPGEQLCRMIESGLGDAVEVVGELLFQAVMQQSSDIHIQPEEGFARLRLRIDGVLESVGLVGPELYAAVCGRIKVLAELDVADTRSVQDGQFSQALCGEEHSFRVSVLPTDRGEAIVVRLLAADRRAVPLEVLGIDADSMRQLRAAAAVQDGLLLIAGPTGSGKTTTLHSLLDLLKGPACNVITLEDPVEYSTPWLRQTSVDSEHGIDYADGVRAALRQDPDVLLIGEIRDAESARMAWRAAMTGHRVLSTVHSTGAIAGLARLQDLGIGPALMASQLVAIAAQRLVRRLCPDCASQGQPPFSDAPGCKACRGRGYVGRIPVVEVLRFDSIVREAVETGCGHGEIARRAGFVSIAERAWSAVLQGLTTVEEYRRVIGPPPVGDHDA